MTEEKDWTTGAIQRWYARHGLPYQKEDWGERAETGESIGQQTQQPERSPAPPKRDPKTGKLTHGSTSVRSSDPTPARMWWWERRLLVWHKRTPAEQDWVEVLDLFFAPYLAMLPRAKGNLVRQVYGDAMTYQEVADERASSRQAAHKATRRAVAHLTRLIAQDDLEYVASGRGDPGGEEAAAQRVFERFLEQHRKEEA